MYLQFQSSEPKIISFCAARNELRSTSGAPSYNESYSPFRIDRLSENELTIVTAYFHIGEFQKGGGGSKFTPQLYRNWMTVFAQIKNPVVAYFDNASDASLMRVLRKKHPKTRIVVIERSKLWSFRETEPRIAKIFSQKFYPWNPPNTVLSSYSAAMHAKYELMQWTILDNPFKSAYICWMDVGYFRDLVTQSDCVSVEDKSFRLCLPAGLYSSAIAYSLVYSDQPRRWLTAEQVVSQNLIFACGGFFIGRVDVMFDWTTEYLTAVERMVSEKWISTDEQVLYWLFFGQGYAKLNPRTCLQLYKGDGRIDPWYYLGYLAKEAGEKNRSSLS